ncbi:MAG: hypothetical protein GC178_07590 [Flavobacteriales bacterium]|nr:hypothetical protein [Flavobacteriales bacterium]
MNKLGSGFIFALAAAIFFLVVWFTFKDVNLGQFVQNTALSDVLKLFGLGLIFHLSFGVIMWVAFWLHYKLRLPAIEILTLPLMMHLFLYLMPMKGGMLFQVFYSKHKYHLDMSKGFSLGLMVFLNSLLLTIFLGLAMIYLLPVDSLRLKLIIWAMGAGLVGMVVSMGFLPSANIVGEGLLNRFLNFLINVRVQLMEQFKNIRLFFGLLITTLVSVIIQAFWFWQTALALDFPCAFAPVLLVVLILRIILLVRVLPGNLGVQELMIGVVFATAGFQMEEGLMIGVITRLISVFWSAMIGLPALYANLKYFDSHSLKGLLQRVSRADR